MKRSGAENISTLHQYITPRQFAQDKPKAETQAILEVYLTSLPDVVQCINGKIK